MLGRILVGSHCFSQLLLVGNVFSGTGEVCFAAASHHDGVYSLRLTDQPAATVLITEDVVELLSLMDCMLEPGFYDRSGTFFFFLF